MKLWMFMLILAFWSLGGLWIATHLNGVTITAAYGFGTVFGSLGTFADFKLAPKDGWQLF